MIKKEFQYTLTEQNEICLISFSGYLSKQTTDILDECIDRVESSKCNTFMFNFKDVEFIARSSHRFLVQVQKRVRDREETSIMLCAIDPQFKQEMIEGGIVRASEVYESAKEVILNLKKK